MVFPLTRLEIVILEVELDVSYCKYCLQVLEDPLLDAHPSCLALVQKYRESIPDRQTFEQLAELLHIDYDHLSFLTDIDLSGQDLTALPFNLEIFSKVRVIDLSNNLLRELPASIGQLTELRELRLDENYLEFLPQSITTLTKLTKLTISRNQLKELPRDFGNLTNLEILSFLLLFG